MANKTLLAQIKQRSDTAANWTAKNPIISDGELIIVTTNAGEKRFKVGDGEKTFIQLPYADENILSKIKTYTAGDGISISDTGVISSTGGGSGSDVFIIEFTSDNNNNITGASKTFEETKQAIESNKIVVVQMGTNDLNPCLYQIFLSDVTNEEGYPLEQILLKFSYAYIFNHTVMLSWIKNSSGAEEFETAFDESPVWFSNDSDLSNSGAAYWNASNKEWEIKDITSTAYKAVNGISISNDGTISVTAAKIYSGTSNAPSADLGENGDIYIQTEG